MWHVYALKNPRSLETASCFDGRLSKIDVKAVKRKSQASLSTQTPTVYRDDRDRLGTFVRRHAVKMQSNISEPIFYDRNLTDQKTLRTGTEYSVSGRWITKS